MNLVTRHMMALQTMKKAIVRTVLETIYPISHHARVYKHFIFLAIIYKNMIPHILHLGKVKYKNIYFPWLLADITTLNYF